MTRKVWLETKMVIGSFNELPILKKNMILLSCEFNECIQFFNNYASFFSTVQLNKETINLKIYSISNSM